MNFFNSTFQTLPYDLESVVEDVKNSKCFGRSGRQLLLFEHLISQSFEGLSNQVTQYTIALDVLNRSESFDPNIDSIVRVEMHRLRANIETYNAGDAKYLISFPPASFDVVVQTKSLRSFNWRMKKPFPLAIASLIAVSGFAFGQSQVFRSDSTKVTFADTCSKYLPNLHLKNVGVKSDTQTYVDKVLRSAIAQQTGFNLVEPEGICDDVSAPEFNLSYAIVENGEHVNVAISINDKASLELIGSYHFSESVIGTQNEFSLYFEIVKAANSIVMPDGMLARAASRGNWPLESYRLSFSCLLSMYDSYSGGTQEEIERVNNCLERSASYEFVVPDVHGALASSYLEVARNNSDVNGSNALAKAVSILSENGDAWTESAELTIAKLYYESQRKDFNAERFNALLIDAKMKYNTNPQVLNMVSAFYGYSLGEWEMAKATSRRIKKLYSITDQSMSMVDAGYALMVADSKEIMKECSKFYSQGSTYSNVIVNACARKAGSLYWFELTEENLKLKGKAQIDKRMEVFSTFRHDPQFMELMNSIFIKEIDL